MVKVSKILVAVDFSPGSRAAVEYGAMFARALQSTVTLFHVYQTPDSMSAIVPGADGAADDAKDRGLAQTWLEKLRTEAKEYIDVEVAVLVEHGSPAEEIVALSHRSGFDLVVMGTHGRTGIRHVLMGSVAEAVVRLAPCPVLTIHLPLRSDAT